MDKMLYDLIPEAIKQEWDQEDYKILCPETLEDTPIVKVVLINKNETELVVDLPIKGEQ